MLQPQSQVGAHTVTVTGLPGIVGSTLGVVQSRGRQVGDGPPVYGKHWVTVPVAVITLQTSASWALAAATRTAPDKAVKCLILPRSREKQRYERVDGQNKYREVSAGKFLPKEEPPL